MKLSLPSVCPGDYLSQVSGTVVIVSVINGATPRSRLQNAICQTFIG